MNNLIIVLVVVIFLLIVVGLLFLLKKISLVKENSVKVLKVIKLNNNFNFVKNCKKRILIYHYVTKKEEISKIEIENVLKELFFDNTNNVLVNFENVLKNEEEYVSYEKKYYNIKDKTGRDFVKLTNLSEKNFKFIEAKLFKMYKEKPIVKTKIKLIVKFDGLKDEHTYKKDKVFNFEELKTIYNDR